MKVVNDFSSKLDLPLETETVESIDANHMQMARFSSREDHGYRAIRSILKSLVQNELESKASSASIADLTRTSDVTF